VQGLSDLYLGDQKVIWEKLVPYANLVDVVVLLGGGFKHFLFVPLLGEDFHFG